MIKSNKYFSFYPQKSRLREHAVETAEAFLCSHQIRSAVTEVSDSWKTNRDRRAHTKITHATTHCLGLQAGLAARAGTVRGAQPQQRLAPSAAPSAHMAPLCAKLAERSAAARVSVLALERHLRKAWRQKRVLLGETRAADLDEIV